MADIFISYKREEQPIARKLADAFQMKGWSVWWDPEVRGGERFDDVIDKALKESKCVVTLWSKLSVESQNVKDEATYALNRDKLVPIMIEVVDLPYRFERVNTRQLVDWDGSDASDEFQNLIDDIAKIIGTPPAEVEKRKRKQEEEKKTRKKEDKPIVVIPTRQLWRVILLTSIGWAIGVAIGYGLNSAIGRPISSTISGTIGGLITMIALRQVVSGIQSKQVLFATIGWAIGSAITSLVPMLGSTIDWPIGGLVTMIALRQVVSGIQSKQVLFATIGWAIGKFFGSVVGVAIGSALISAIGEAIAWPTSLAIGSAIGGAIGVGGILLLLARAEHSD
jgi:hypothetical protein